VYVPAPEVGERCSNLRIDVNQITGVVDIFVSFGAIPDVDDSDFNKVAWARRSLNLCHQTDMLGYGWYYIRAGYGSPYAHFDIKASLVGKEEKTVQWRRAFSYFFFFRE